MNRERFPRSGWIGRDGSCPFVYGSQLELVTNLRTVVTAIREADDIRQTIPWNGRMISAREALVHLGPCGLFRRVRPYQVVLTDHAQQWLDSDDSSLLVGILHSRVKYFGEILAEVQKRPSTVPDLNSVAANEYGIAWKNHESVRHRVSWLWSMGALRRIRNNHMELTELGRDVLEELEVETAESVASLFSGGGQEATVPPAGPGVLARLRQLDPEALRNRRMALVFIPHSDRFTIIGVLRDLTDRFRAGLSREQYRSRCRELFGIGSQAADGSLSTLRSSGLIELVSRGHFRTTELANEWLDSGDDLNLIRIMHCHVRFFGEILSEIDDAPTAGELSVVSQRQYGDLAVPVSGMWVRLRLLRDAGLLVRLNRSRHRLTPLGDAVRSGLPVPR